MRVFDVPESIRDQYHGSGHALAAISGGELKRIVYVEDIIPGYDPDEDGIDAAILQRPDIGVWALELSRLGEVSVGMCSAQQFCEL